MERAQHCSSVTQPYTGLYVSSRFTHRGENPAIHDARHATKVGIRGGACKRQVVGGELLEGAPHGVSGCNRQDKTGG